MNKPAWLFSPSRKRPAFYGQILSSLDSFCISVIFYPVYYYDPNGGCVDANNKSIPCPPDIPEKGNEYTLIAEEFTFEHEVSGFESFLDMLYDLSNWNGGGGFEFYNTGKAHHGEPLYWVRNGKAYGAYYNVSDNMIVFGKLGDRKAFPKGHMPTTKNWASTSKVNAEGFKDLLDGAQLGGGVKENVINVIIKTSTAPHQGIKSEPDSSWNKFWIDRNGSIREDSMKIRNY